MHTTVLFRIAMLLLTTATLLLAGCPGEEAPDPIHVSIDAECENINPEYCMLPWPSSRYLVADTGTETGWRLEYVVDAFAENERDELFDVEPYNRLDGYSPSSQIMTLFAEPVDGSTLPSYLDYDASLADDSPTVLLDMSTGERVAHFAEFDSRFDDPSEIMLYIRPAQRLEENTRYAVAIRDLTYDAGGAVPPSEVFAALRDGVITDADQVEARRDSFEEIFTALEGANVPRTDLIQAWDFHTASGAMLWGDLLAMRDDAMERLGEDGLGCTITYNEPDEEHQDVYRRVEGTITVPSYMDSPYPPARVVRGADGLPEFQENVEIEFLVNIPYSVGELGATGRLVTYGHGLMDEKEAVFYGSEGRAIANQYEMVMVATDWDGMSTEDIVTVATALSNVSSFPAVAERVMQGIINQLALTRTMAGVCTEEEAFQMEGNLVYDPDELYYMGSSQGAIYGQTYMALSQDVERGVLNVGGTIYPVLIGRSVDFEDYEIIYTAWYPDRIDREFYMSVIGQMWDLCEGINFLPHLIADPFPDTPAKKIIYQVGLYDAQVPNVASDMAARTIGLQQLTPTMHDVWGIEDAPSGDFDGSAIQYWSLNVEPVPEGNEAPLEDNDAHTGVRQTESAKAQVDAFFHPDGVVTNQCDGECDPE